MPNQGCVLPALYLPFLVSALKSMERVKRIDLRDFYHGVAATSQHSGKGICHEMICGFVGVFRK